MTGRETAWRVLAHEFESSVQEEVGTGERAAHHLLSPLGARMNRVLIVGTLAVPESVGRDPSAPFLRARLSDPTGAFTVTAGGFQPKALAAFQAIREPLRSLVVGKAHLYTGRDGVATSSVRAEGLRTIG
ncbi:MAG: DNA-binding protein, partial [Thermoplasmata archaeon]|nr:DNA-binding protein [Thermoplasmata archaeon]